MNLAFFEIGASEMLVVGFVALLLFGGRLPEVMRNLGAAYRNLRRGMDDLKSQAMRPDLTVGKPPAATPYRPRAMPTPTSGGVALTPPPAPLPPAPSTGPAAAQDAPSAAAPRPPTLDDAPPV